MSGRERRMSAEVGLVHWREPAQIPAIRIGLHKGGLGQIVLAGNRLHCLYWQPIIKDKHCGRIAAKEFGGKCVYLIHRQ